MNDPNEDLRRHWTLDPDVVFLNHGSFGACPRVVLEAQSAWRARLEAEPVRFFLREYEGALDATRRRLADFLGASPDDLAFVPNATTGVNTVLRSLDLAPGDEVLVTDHAYGACRNALDFVAARRGARVATAAIPFPLSGPEDVLEPLLDAVTPRTRWCLLDEVTSPTGIVLPVDAAVAALRERGVETLVDAAHSPGMIDVHLDRTGAAFTTGNLHKWVCAPKGAAYLHVRRDLRDRIRPLVISHGATAPLGDRSRFHLEMDWVGTIDPTPILSVPAALDFLETVVPGGAAGVRARNHQLAVRARAVLAGALGVPLPCPDSMLGSLASVPLPDHPREGAFDVLAEYLWHAHRIEVPVAAWPASPKRLLRIAAQLYNRIEDYERLAAALRDAPTVAAPPR